MCGAEYRYTHSKQRTCGRTCGLELRRREGTLRKKWPTTRVYFPQCLECGAVFTARRPEARLCSDDCRASRRVAWRAKDKRRPPVDWVRRCACGVAIDRHRQKCDACIEANRRAARQRKRKADKARHRGIKSEPYTLIEIAERDRFKCGLCRRKVPMNRAVPHPKAPTIDHVLPIAVGGDDTRANVQLAHFQCNVRKSVGGSQQLALIG